LCHWVIAFGAQPIYFTFPAARFALFFIGIEVSYVTIKVSAFRGFDFYVPIAFANGAIFFNGRFF
jgi:hypothetical protein